jgi:hypothetical protein
MFGVELLIQGVLPGFALFGIPMHSCEAILSTRPAATVPHFLMKSLIAEPSSLFTPVLSDRILKR